MPKTIMRQCKCALFDSDGYNLGTTTLPKTRAAGFNGARVIFGLTGRQRRYFVGRGKIKHKAVDSRWEIMKQYKLTAWPELPPRFQKTTMRRVVSELSQRFVSVRDLARSSGAGTRDIEELLSTLEKDGILMTRAAPQTVSQSGGWHQWWPVAAVRGMVRDWAR